MRAIIAGSRTATKEDTYEGIRLCLWSSKISVVLSGHAIGADIYGEQWSKERGLNLEIYPANWEKWGKSAGFIRNAKMVNLAEGLIAIWNGTSPGTKHIISLAKKSRIKVFVYNFKYESWISECESRI